MGTIGIVPPGGHIVDGILPSAPDEDYAEMFRRLRLLISCLGPPFPAAAELREALETVARAERDAGDYPDYETDRLAVLVDEYFDLANWIEDHRKAGIECEWMQHCVEYEREIPGLVAKLLPWIETAPPEATAEPVLEPTPEDPPLTDEDRATLRKKITEARDRNPTLASSWNAFSGTRPADLPAGERDAALEALLALARHLEDGMGLTRQEVNFAIEVRCAEVGGIDSVTTTPMPVSQQEPTANDQPTPIDWNPLKKLKDALEAAEKVVDAEIFYASLPLTNYVNDAKYDNLIGAIKVANTRAAKHGFHISVNRVHEFRRRSRASAGKSNNICAAFSTAQATGKPRINVNGKQLGDLRAEAVAALQLANKPPVIFRRERDLVRFAVDAGDQPFLDVVNWISMRSMLSDAAHFYKSEGGVGTFPPRPLCEEVVVHDHERGTFPALDAIARAPVVRQDGTICDTPGYDLQSRLLYVPPPGFKLPSIPASPTAEQIEAAADKLRHVTVDFRFETKADQTNFFAFLLTPIVRPLLDVVPLAAIDSPTSGAGKSLLTDVVSVVATGEVCAVIPPPTTAEEWGKLLPALLDSGNTFICFDNLHDVLKSAALEAVLTKPLLQFRQLGQTKERIVRNCAVWCATGNNITVSKDAVRRCYRIRIDPRCAQPHLRKNFTHPNLVEYVKAERGNLLAALLVLVRAWFAAGKPGFNATALGTFTSWKTTVGGILRHAGFVDFLANQRTLYSEMDEESAEWESFLLRLEEVFERKEFSVGQVVNMIHSGTVGGLPRELAKIYCSSTTHVKSKPNAFFGVQVGHVLRAKRGTCFGEAGVCIDRATEDRHAKVILYKIAHGKES